MRKGNAIIRAVLHDDPDGLDDNQWAARFNEALWYLKKFQPYMFR